jgi:hypothetical protein
MDAKLQKKRTLTRLPSELVLDELSPDIKSKGNGPNDIRQLRNDKQLDRIKLDLDSPLFRKACKNLGIDTRDCRNKSYE